MKKNQSKKVSSIKPTNVTMPTGGGAIQGIGETFKSNSFTGSGSYSIEIPIPVARGFEPHLQINYSSGNGNGIFGLGFSLDIPKVSIRTENGTPTYQTKQRFLLSGIELVPTESGQSVDSEGYEVYEFLPRIQTDFSLIEYHVKPDQSQSYWRVVTSENKTSIYGKSEDSCILNPNNKSQIFEWLLESSFDNKGNIIQYQYKSENQDKVPKELWAKGHSYNNKYLEKVLYGNYLDSSKTLQFAYEVLFNYGEYDLSSLAKGGFDPLKTKNKWNARPDPYSSFKAGFEIRTCRLCQDIVIIHNFKEDLGDPVIVKSLNFTYQLTNSYGVAEGGHSILKNVQTFGYRRKGNDSIDAYNLKSMPPVIFDYSDFNPPANPVFKKFSAGENELPDYLNTNGFSFVDLNSEGISGLFYQNDNTLLYLEPQGNAEYNFPQQVTQFPLNNKLSNGSSFFSDLNGNGHLDLATHSNVQQGFYPRNTKLAWDNFQAFDNYTKPPTETPPEMVGLSGNGKSDLLCFLDDDLLFYKSLGSGGYENPKQIPMPDGFPVVKPGFKQEYVGFANVFGDGLTHRIKVSNGLFECWPSLSYGNFANKVSIGNAPHFGDDFDTSRIYFADIDGSGCADLLYAYPDRIDLFLNQNGNFLSDPISISLPETFSNLDKIQFSDVLGNGTSCLIFTKIEPIPKHYYYNFIGQLESDGMLSTVLKPYLLSSIENSMGLKTEIQYCSSTKFYLEDRENGMEWPTRLHFPVQVVEKIITTDLISKIRYSNKFKYHNGYYDSVEREFRGFGFIESWDTEDYAEYSNYILSSSGVNKALSEPSFVPPVYTKKWYHTGAYLESPAIKVNNQRQFFSGDSHALDFPESVYDPAILKSDSETVRQAYASLKGKVLRTETYGMDGSDLQENPYSVEETNYAIKLYQDLNENLFAVFMNYPLESITYNYERNPNDPAVEQEFLLDVDDYGNILQTCSVYLPRRLNTITGEVALPEQQVLKGTVEAANFVKPLKIKGGNQNTWCHISWENQSIELSGLDTNGEPYFSLEVISQQSKTALGNAIPYSQNFLPKTLASRIYIWEKSYYWDEDINRTSDPLDAGLIGEHALLHHNEGAIFDNDYISSIYDDAINENTIYQYGGYFLDSNNNYWWNKGLVQYYFGLDSSPDKSYYLPTYTQNDFAIATQKLTNKQAPSLCVKTEIVYDSYFFKPNSISQDGANKQVLNQTFQYDYYVLKPYNHIDSNNNSKQVLYDELGFVVATTLFGKENGKLNGGMTLYESGANPAEFQLKNPSSLDDLITNPEDYVQGAASFFYYDFDNWTRSQQPIVSVNLLRNNDWHQTKMDLSDFCQIEASYNDGSGRVVEKRQLAQVESKKLIKQQSSAGQNMKPHYLPKNIICAWRVSGKTVFNNKAKPFEQYLPFYSDGFDYEAVQPVDLPPPSILHYDAMARVIKIETPKKLFTKVEFTPWETKRFDEDDTVDKSEYYMNFKQNYPKNPTQEQINELFALNSALKFVNTPKIFSLDNMGHQIRKTEYKSSSEKLVSFYETDIQGRETLIIDPRLYASNNSINTNYFNFKQHYAMGLKKPLVIQSADAGLERHLNNIFQAQTWSLSPRNYCQLFEYDLFARKKTLLVKKLSTLGGKINTNEFNTVEEFTYGDDLVPSKTKEELQEMNLWGALYQVNDLSGIVLTTSYSIRNDLLQTSRQYLFEYKTPVNWSSKPKPKLDSNIENRSFSFNALKQAILESTPDKTETRKQYNLQGGLSNINLTFEDKTKQEVISNIFYDAQNQRTKVLYGNSVSTSYKYEDTTNRLLLLKSTKPGTLPDSIIQYESYTYDPVGNVVRVFDSSFETVFWNKQVVKPLSEYVYDAMYRLTNATGRQHPGITSTTFKNNKSAGDFMQSKFSKLSPSENNVLEKYSEVYTYDDSNNLVSNQHIAVSKSWTRLMPVEDDSNHQRSIGYDASGNLQKLDLNNNAKLSYNCCEKLVKTGIIKRDGNDDADYYMYDVGGQRTRKVTERAAYGGTVTQIDDKKYFGNYIITKQYSGDAEDESNVEFERQTLRVMDGSNCVVIIHSITKDQKHPTNIGERSFRFQLSNELDSVSLEYSEKTELISYEEYFPYGGTSIIAGESITEVALKTYRYAAKERDDTTGLYYYGARYYLPWMGRWLTPDPIGKGDGLNLYSYVGGNPVTMKDPSGTSRKARLVRTLSQRSDSGSESSSDDERLTFAAPGKRKRPTKKARKLSVPAARRAIQEAHGSSMVESRRIHSSRLYVGITHETVEPDTSMTAERLLVRHLSTALLHMDSGRVEVQAAISHSAKTIYISSNKKDAALGEAIGENHTLSELPDFDDIGTGRVARHITKLQTEKNGAFKDYKLVHVGGLSDQHAETKIFDSGVDFDYIGGTRRPCLACFIYFQVHKLAQSKYNPHPGAYWDSIAALLSLHGREDEIAKTSYKGIFYKNAGSALRNIHDNDTDSEGEEEDI